MSETLKTLEAKRDSLLSRADGLQRTDPKMAKYLRDLAGEMDSELEGVDPIQQRDENGFLQGEDPDYVAFNEARARIAGRQADNYPDDPAAILSTSPIFQSAVNKHLSQQLQAADFANRAPAQSPVQQVYDNSVTPSGQSLKSILYPDADAQ